MNAPEPVQLRKCCHGLPIAECVKIPDHECARETASVFWALCFHTNSNSPRARRCYYVTRAVALDGRTYAIGAHVLRGTSRSATEAHAKASGLRLTRGLWRAPVGTHEANEIVPATPHHPEA